MLQTKNAFNLHRKKGTIHLNIMRYVYSVHIVALSAKYKKRKPRARSLAHTKNANICKQNKQPFSMRCARTRRRYF